MRKFISRAIAVSMIVVMTHIVSLPQTRIRFARGRSSATVTGNIGAGGSRMYVLAARAGQTLYARIRSGNGRVTITLPNGRGTTSDEYITEEGDNTVGIYNSGGATKFTLTVSIR